MSGHVVDVVNDLPREQLPDFYDSARALLLPTFYAQGYDLSIAEALARRRPSIVSCTGSYRREVMIAKTSVVIPLNDAGALANALSSPMPEVPVGAADMHHPAAHAQAWLTAVCN